MPPGLEAEKLAVQHRRKPGDRMPVCAVHRGEGPLDRGPGDARLNMRIVQEIGPVVEHIAVAEDMHVNDYGCEDQRYDCQARSDLAETLAGHYTATFREMLRPNYTIMPHVARTWGIEFMV